MLTRHAIEHKRANNPYRCTIDGCLDSYAERRKLITHLNYKHTGLSKKEREVMIMKGDELLKKLRNISLNGSSTYCSKILPISSSTIDITGQIMSLSPPSLSKPERISISVNTVATEASNNQSLVSLSPSIIDIISTNHILMNTIKNVEFKGNDETLLKTNKSTMHNIDIMPCVTTNSTGVIVNFLLVLNR
ncbi:hypothetical protein LOAG_13722 [Loa loa]|uniref:C2H2-type domain-containing protein n=1 Tax=Loa loa TaxID=7209 RepID=A0A1S0TIX4_LOALO|nr:hypothetical protein LOAG_13722 [Loa loa]EFO14795.2 hypothetical protein LOAG_13722 [Loa loa]